MAWAETLGGAVAGGATVEAARRDLGSAVVAQERRWQVEYPRRGLERLAGTTGVRAGRAAPSAA